MGRPRLYPDEFWDRAVWLVHEWRKERGVAEGGLQAVADQRSRRHSERPSLPRAGLGRPYAPRRVRAAQPVGRHH